MFCWIRQLEYFTRNLRANLTFTNCGRLITYRLSLLLYDHLRTLLLLSSYKYIKTLFLFSFVAYRLSCRTKYETIPRLTICPISHRLLSLACLLLRHKARSSSVAIISPVFNSLLCQKDVATSFAILLTNFCGKVT